MPNPLPTARGTHQQQEEQQDRVSSQRIEVSKTGEGRVDSAVDSERGMRSGEGVNSDLGGEGSKGCKVQGELDRVYEERMEDEYAKREGGA